MPNLRTASLRTVDYGIKCPGSSSLEWHCGASGLQAVQWCIHGSASKSIVATLCCVLPDQYAITLLAGCPHVQVMCQAVEQAKQGHGREVDWHRMTSLTTMLFQQVGRRHSHSGRFGGMWTSGVPPFPAGRWEDGLSGLLGWGGVPVGAVLAGQHARGFHHTGASNAFKVHANTVLNCFICLFADWTDCGAFAIKSRDGSEQGPACQAALLAAHL